MRLVWLLLALLPTVASAQLLEPRVDRLECRDSGGLWEAGECLCATGREFVPGEGCVGVLDPPPPNPEPEPEPEPDPEPEPPPTGALASAEWRSIPGSEMRSIYVSAIDDQWDDVGASRSFETVQAGYSGGACIGSEIVVMGGGHGDGAHNGVFAVNVHTGQWRRVTMPSPIWRSTDCPTGVCENVPNDPDGSCQLGRCGVGPDGRPVARHTYANPATDGTDFYLWSGSIWPHGSSGEAPHAFRLDMAEGEWYPLPQRRCDPEHDEDCDLTDMQIPNRPHGSSFVANGRWYHLTSRRQGGSYDFQARTWTPRAIENDFPIWNGVTSIHVPTVNRVFAIGAGTAWTASLATWPMTDYAALGVYGGAQENGPGVTYYEPEDLVLVWAGGREIDVLDPRTYEWSTLALEGEDPGPQIQGSSGPNGTYERFNFCDGRVVLVNGVDKPLFYLDLTEPEEPNEPPPPPPPPGVVSAPYYAEPPVGIVEEQCGPESEWEVVDVRTDEDAENVRNFVRADSRLLVRVYPKATPYPGIRTKGAKCSKVIGVGSPRPTVLGVNATRAFRDEIRDGGLVVENLHVTIPPGNGSDCIGVPSDQRFLIIRDSEVGRCGHHSFVAAHAHHLYVEIGRSSFYRGGTHNAYINHVAMAWVYDSTFESPGIFHSLRCIALRCRIERTKVSNVQLDGSTIPRDDGKPIIGMHPLEVYTCGENEVRDVEVTLHTGGQLWGASLRAREDLPNTCDVGEVRDGQWTPLAWGTAEFRDPARWGTTTDLVTTVERFSLRCVGPRAAECSGWDVQTSYPWASDKQTGPLSKWLEAEAFATWDELVTRLEEDSTLPWWWGWLVGRHELVDGEAVLVDSQVLPGHRDSVLQGKLTNKVPLPVPVPGWRQRALIVFDEKPILRPHRDSTTYCLGLPVTNGECAEQASGRSFNRAFVEVR